MFVVSASMRVVAGIEFAKVPAVCGGQMQAGGAIPRQRCGALESGLMVQA